MLLENKSTRKYVAFDVELEAKSTLEVTNEEAIKILLKQEGVCEFADVKKQKDLEKENEALKKQVALAEAKAEATKLGIKFQPNIGLEKLLAKIEEAKTSNTGDENVDAFLNGETDELPEGTEEITEEEANELENK